MVYSFLTFLPFLVGCLISAICFYRATVANIEMMSAGLLVLISVGSLILGAIGTGIVFLIQNFGVCT